MKMRYKILCGFLILSSMLFTAGLLSIYEFNNIGDSVKSLLDENYRSINASKDMIEALEREDSGILLVLLGHRDEGRATINESDSDFQKSFQIAQDTITIPEEEELIGSIGTAYNNYKQLWNHLIAETHQKKDLNWYFNSTHPAFLEVKTAVNNLMTLNDKTMYQTATKIKDKAGRAIMPGIIAIVSALVFTVIFDFFIHLYVIKPVKKLTEGIQNFLQTGQRINVQVENHDELGKLSEAVQELTFKLDSR